LKNYKTPESYRFTGCAYKHSLAQSTPFSKYLLPVSAADTCAESILHTSLDHANVSWYLGSRKAKVLAMAPGLQSNSIMTMLVMSSAVSLRTRRHRSLQKAKASSQRRSRTKAAPRPACSRRASRGTWPSVGKIMQQTRQLSLGPFSIRHRRRSRPNLRKYR
jgi:hypothetical protein